MKQWLPFLMLGAFLLSGCITQQPTYRPVVKKPKPKPTKPKPKPKPAKPKPIASPKKKTKVYKLKKVQDNNFDPDYMYPETPKRTRTQTKTDTTPVNVAARMGREECIGMIGQTKFDKYTQMLGSEDAAIKRCILMKSMK